MSENPITPVHDHFYDGWFYRQFIDPSLTGIRKRINELVPPGSRVLEVGSGSGDQLLQLAPQIKTGLGVELSPKMVRFSQAQARRQEVTHCKFEHRDAAHLNHLPDGSFDIALSSMVIHEIPATRRLPVLSEMKRLGRTLIIADWIYPQPSLWKHLGTHLVEWAAGRDHYVGFRSFMRTGGVPNLLELANLHIEASQVTSKGTIQLWVCSQ